ncbi:metallophosphoesterase [Actinokineospora bangkokensis]|uniref:Metallophosphatase n=1 Tax=Actinokineospora bangkokensis TaxID=1193682 RepID=A0A1Q9LFL0_9PSEU|nr:metallophosphoesterase [Actinokineospora bangkokensis]OLR90821.1 metallophosphatase [Actinokineospora bangkokensis]
MLFAVLGLLVVLLHYYLWKRLVRDVFTSGRARLVGTVVLVVLVVCVLATLTLARVVPPQVGAWFAWPGYIWLALFLYLMLALLVLELVRLALRPWVRADPAAAQAEPTTAETEAEPRKPVVGRRVFLARSAAVVAGVASATTVGVGMGTALGGPQLKRVPVPVGGSALRGYRIAVVSDIHLGPISGRAHTERIVRAINETEPDLVAMVGDLADGSVPELGEAAAPLRDLVSREGTFFVTGNHEYYSGHEQWITELERLGLHYLRNEHTLVAGDRLTLAGVPDVTGKSFSDAPDIPEALRGRRPELPTVLLAHQPVQVADAAAAGVDLQLSGHTHGGQLWPFHYAVRAAQPAVSGLSQVDGTWLYVSNGAGFWGPPVRVGAPPDITVVELGGPSQGPS